MIYQVEDVLRTVASQVSQAFQISSYQWAIGAMGLWDADSAMFDTFCLWYSLCSLYFQHVARRILALFGIIGLEGVGIILAAIAFARNRDAIQSLGHKMSPHCPGFLHASLHHC